MPERLECEVLQKARYINTLIFTFTFYTIHHRTIVISFPLILQTDILSHMSLVWRGSCEVDGVSSNVHEYLAPSLAVNAWSCKCITLSCD